MDTNEAPTRSHGMRPSWFRRRLLVYPMLQITLIVFPISLILLVIVLARFQDEIISSFPSGRLIFFAGLLIISGYAILFSMELSNRIVGPIYRIRNHIKEIANGAEPRDIQFRQGDQFAELAADYNRLLQRLREAERSDKHN